MDQDRILDKIKKCLALSQSPETHEAAAAHAGLAAGKGESLHRPLNERAPTLQIGG